MNGTAKKPEGFRYETVLRKGRPIHAPFDAFSVRHPPMPLRRRAKIFSPFDALKGFSEAIAEKEAASLCGEDASRAADAAGPPYSTRDP